MTAAQKLVQNTQNPEYEPEDIKLFLQVTLWINISLWTMIFVSANSQFIIDYIIFFYL